MTGQQILDQVVLPERMRHDLDARVAQLSGEPLDPHIERIRQTFGEVDQAVVEGFVADAAAASAATVEQSVRTLRIDLMKGRIAYANLANLATIAAIVDRLEA